MDNRKATLAICNEPWPEDTERKRVADLQAFVKKHPGYLDTLPQDEREDLLAQANTQFPEAGKKYHGHFADETPRTFQNGDAYGELLEEDILFEYSECEQKSKNDKIAGKNEMQIVTRLRGRPHKHNNENKWDLETTLELLDSMKAFVIRHEVPCVGVATKKWMEVAMSLANPRQMELQKFARSCQVRYDNIRRYLNAGMPHRVDKNIRKSVIQYLQICHRYANDGTLRLKTQNTVYRYKHQERYACSQEVSRTYKRRALSKSTEKTILSPKPWKHNPTGSTGDDSLVLVPSENSELEWEPDSSATEPEILDSRHSMEIDSLLENQIGGERDGEMNREGPSRGEQRMRYEENYTNRNKKVVHEENYAHRKMRREENRGKQKEGHEKDGNREEEVDWEGRSRVQRKVHYEKGRDRKEEMDWEGHPRRKQEVRYEQPYGKQRMQYEENRDAQEYGNELGPELDGVIEGILHTSQVDVSKKL